MRQVLFFIGCILFFSGLFGFIIMVFLYYVIAWHLGCPIANEEMQGNLYLTSVFFLAGTILISNNKPEDK